MIEKLNVPFALSVLTKDAKSTLLNNNVEFDLRWFVFIDDEVNYNLFNPDVFVTVGKETERGLNRINVEDPDVVGDIESTSIFYPNYRIDLSAKNFLFGDTVRHNLLSSQIKNADDVVRDIIGSPIESESEIVSNQRIKKLDFQSKILSGNLSDFYLSSNNLLAWSAAIDIRGILTIYQNIDILTMVEDGSLFNDTQKLQTDGFQPYSDISYVVEFVGDSPDKIFTYTQSVSPFEHIVVSVARLISDQKLSYELFGQFTIYKQFKFQDKVFRSDTIVFSIFKENEKYEPIPILDGKAQIIDLYTSPHDRKNVFVDVPVQESMIVAPKVYGNSVIDSVLNQTRLNGYLKTSPVLHLQIQGSKLNNLTINIQNVSTSLTYNLLTLSGDQITNNGFITIQELSLSLWVYKHLMNDGYHLLSRLDVIPNFGYLELDSTSYEGQRTEHYEYSMFGEKRHKFHVDLQSDVFLGPQALIETANEFQSLYHIFSPDQNLVFNFPRTNPLLMSDYENLIVHV